MSNDGQLSEDGQWRWDEAAAEWVSADQTGGSTQEESSAGSVTEGQLSEDGQWRWDTAAGAWQPVHQGQTTGDEGAEQAIPEDQVYAMMDAAEQSAQTA